MKALRPDNAQDLALLLADASAAQESIIVHGAGSKRSMGGPIAAADVLIDTTALKRVLRYEPRDLTLSVEAGARYADVSKTLAAQRQMLPLDPPYADRATVGGVIAANTSGPRRRLYGTARDLVIGMSFATLDGKVASSGGMVVKNVAGLDMAKLMIGSFGTLAVITSVNFKLAPLPEGSRTFVRSFDSVEEAFRARTTLLGGVLQPAAVDVLNPAAAMRTAMSGWLLAVRASGSTPVIERYGRELEGMNPLEAAEESRFWRSVEEFTPRFLADKPAGAVLRVSSTLVAMLQVMKSLAHAAVARAGSGVCYAHFDSAGAAAEWVQSNAGQKWACVLEHAPESAKTTLTQWSSPGNDFAMMRRVKTMLDPKSLLNRGRLYGRL
jgi:glycolate oxidase FAD binding subunit